MEVDTLLGVNFFRQFIDIMTNETITAKTSCNHSITTLRIYGFITMLGEQLKNFIFKTASVVIPI